MRHPDDQLQAARDLLADGLSRAETAARNIRFAASLRPERRQPTKGRAGANAALLAILAKGG